MKQIRILISVSILLLMYPVVIALAVQTNLSDDDTTVTVAAYNSINKNANYICDGIDDDVEIQQAIDSLPVTGGKVILLDGNYNISDMIRFGGKIGVPGHIQYGLSNVVFEGSGKNTVLKKSDEIIINFADDAINGY